MNGKRRFRVAMSPIVENRLWIQIPVSCQPFRNPVFLSTVAKRLLRPLARAWCAGDMHPVNGIRIDAIDCGA